MAHPDSHSLAFGRRAVAALLRRQPQIVQRLYLAKGRDDARLQALLKLADSQGIAVERLPGARLQALLDGERSGNEQVGNARPGNEPLSNEPLSNEPLSNEPRSNERLSKARPGRELASTARPGRARVSARHQGVIAALRAGPDGSPHDLRWSEARLLEAVRGQARALVLVLDGVTDPHNLGACLRSADAAGATAVVIPKDRAADLTGAVRKVACGATESVPLVRVTNLARCLDKLQAAGLWLFGAAAEAREDLYAKDLTGPLALLVGSEGSGLRRLTRERCDFLVRLPMAGAVSSLNVSVATGICLFEIARQRGFPGAP